MAHGGTMGERRDATTNFIRDAALGELVRAGHSMLTMEGVARASYCSVGSVYARFETRGHLYGDLLDTRVRPAIERAVGTATDPSALLADLVDEGPTAVCVAALTELSMAARFDENLIGGCRSSVAAIRSAVAPGLDNGMKWLVTAVVMGRHFLVAAGCAVPPLAGPLAAFLSRVGAGAPANDHSRDPGPIGAVVPESPSPIADDGLADSLTRETSHELAARGLHGARLTTIAERAGVTTGAVYRRYGSKTELVRDTAIRELGPRRYEWTDEFLDALRGSIERTPGDVLTDQVLTLLQDTERALATLEMIHAARGDETLSRTLAGQFHAAAGARAQMFETLKATGTVNSAMDSQLLGWLIQTAPAGARILLSIEMMVSDDDLRSGLNQVTDTMFGG